MIAGEHKFLSGGGEMGKLIRTKDWSNTPIGNPETWPQSLRTTLSIIINSKFPMFLWWGSDLICFYNDAYRPSLGNDGKHPDILGMKAHEAWPEIWDIIKPLIDQVLAGEGATWSEDQLVPIYRNGKIEDVYWTFSYSPVNDESGKPAGVFVTCVETTEAVVTSKNLLENKDQLQFVIAAAQLGTFDYNPSTNKFSSNARLKNWFGLPLDDQIELTHAIDAIAQKDRERVSNAIKEVLEYSSGGVYDEEFNIVNAISKKEIIVHAKGRAWFNEDKIAYRLNGTVEDVTDQVLARKKIEESERSLRLMILQAPVAIAILRGTDYKVEIANKYALELWGRTEEEVLNISIFDAMPELSSQGIKELLDDVANSGNRFAKSELPLQLLRNGNLETVYINFSYEALYDAEGKINGIMAIGYDVTSQVEARKRVEESEQYIRSLVESAPFPIAVYTGEELRISLANQSIMDVFGKGNDVVGKLYTKILPELQNQQIFEQIREVLRTGIPFHAKNQKVDIVRDGELKSYYFNYSFTPVMDPLGHTYAVMNTGAEVTELQEAKQKVEESEKRFRDSVMQAPLGIVIFRGTENVTEMANEKYLQLIDKTEDQFVGKPLFETIPEVKESIAPIIADVYMTGNAFYGYEFPVRLHRHGKTETNYFNFVYHPLKENNRIAGIMVVATDVTATVTAKHFLEENEEKLNLIIEASELGVFDVNLKSGDMIASDRCYDILGFTNKKKLTQEEIITQVHPDDLKIRTEAFEKAYETGSLHYQIRIIWEDLSLHWKDVKGKVYFDENNKPERMLGTIRDITEEKTFHQQLLVREEKFRLLADSMPQHIWTSDPEGNLNYFNQSVYDYSGLTLRQIYRDGWMQIVHPDDREENVIRWLDSVKTGKDFLFEHRFRRYDGEYRWQLSRAIPQKDANGNIQMWVGSSTDIQNIKEQEQQKDYFISMASHELKTPLTSIKGYVQILQTMHANSEDSFLQKSLKTIDRQLVTLTTLITELLDISKIKSGGLDLNLEHFEITDLIHEVVSEIKHINPNYEIPVTVEKKAVVYADHDRIGQVLINFLTNAVKYAPQSKTINVKCCVKNNSVTVSIQDFGIGINKKEQERVFERFYRVEGSNEKTFPGFGIGLFISSEIIKKHHGKIGVKSDPGKGSVFSFELPVNQ